MMPKRSWLVWLVAALVVGLTFALAACDDGGGGGGDETPTAEGTTVLPEGTATPPEDIVGPDDVLRKDADVTETGEVKWGFLFELSGGLLQGFGEPTGDGVKLAVKEINDAGGFQVGDTIYTINLVERDTQSNVQTTIADTQELIQDEGVNVLWGPATLGETEATQITQSQQVLHLCPCQERETHALSSVEQAENESHWAFQTLLPFSLLSNQGARNFLRDWPQFHSMALLCQNSATGHDVCGRTGEAYAKVGINVVAEEYFPAETTDFSPFLTSIKQKNPDYLFNYDDPLKQASLVRQALELDVGRLQIASLPADLIESLVGRPLTVPVIAGAAPRNAVQPTSQEVADYFERYKAFKGGQLPLASFVSLLTYDYVYMLVAAMQQADTVEDTTAIADALEELHYDGVAEDNMFFNSRHLGVHGSDPCVVETGKPITCDHNPPPPEAWQ